MPSSSARTLDGISIVLDSHEDRLQRVESQATELVGSMGELVGDVKVLTSSFGRIEGSIGLLQQAMESHAVASATRQDELLRRVDGLDRAKALAKAASGVRWGLAKRLALIAVIPLTALLTKFGEWLYSLF